jgi:peptidyl-Asp metalloendopeptidase
MGLSRRSPFNPFCLGVRLGTDAAQSQQSAVMAGDYAAESSISNISCFTVFRKLSHCLLAFVSLLTLIVAAGAAPGIVGGTQRNLFVDVPAPPMAVERRATISRHRSVTVDVAALRGQRSVGAGLHLNLFNDAAFEGLVEQVIERGPDDFSLLGRLNGQVHASFALAFKDNVAVMNVRTPKGMFHLRHLGNNFYEVREIDETKFPPCATTQKHAVPSPDAAIAPPTGTAGADLPAPDGTLFVDVLVVYTPASRAAAGGTAAMEALINLAVDESNVAYQRSQVITRLRLVHQREVAYTEAGFSTDLNRLTSTSDGFLDEVHALRNTYGADVVSMLIKDSQYCGLAWVMTSLSPSFASSAFSAVAWDCATGYYSFSHEIGHNMGCGHDRANAGSGLYPYSYGWRFLGTNGAQYRTIMAYDPGTRIQHFSNPDVSFFGTPTGVPVGQPEAAHNALTINNSASTVANFRASVIGCTNTSLTPLSTNVSYLAGTGSASVGAPLNCSWTAVSGSSFITISGGGGGTGNGTFTYSFTQNPSASPRTGTIAVAAKTLTIVQGGAPSLGDVLDAPGYIWTTGGNVPWFAQSAVNHDGVDAAQSGTIIRNQQSYLETIVNGPMNVSFWWKVSSEPGDVLRYSVDGAVSNQISGEINWQQIVTVVPPGSHALRWTYSKNNNVNGGTDAAWLDQVILGPALPPDHLALVAGNNQTASAGTVLPVNPSVQVQDAAGNPVPGVVVNFTVQAGGGSVGSASVTTGPNGLASTSYTLGTLSGSNRLTASAALPGSPNSITFTANGVAGPAHHIAILSQPSATAAAGVAFTEQPAVRVEDQYGNLRVSDNSTLITASRAAGAGALQGAISANVSGGIATFSNLAHLISTNITIAFSSPGLLSATSSVVSVAPSAPARLTLQRQPSSSATAGVAFAQQPIVRVEDTFGNLVTNDSSTTVTAARNSGSGTLQGTTTGTATNGLAVFTDLSHLVATALTINFTAGVLNAATSTTVNVSAGSFAQLQVLTPGETADPGTTTGKAGAPLSQRVGLPLRINVTAVDAYWNRVASATDVVNIVSSDAAAVLPVNAALIAGTNSFAVTFKTAGAQTFTASDVSNAGKLPNTSSPVDVLKGTQAVTFASLPAKTYGDAPFPLIANASSGLPITFSVVSGAASISGNTLTITDVGPVTVRAAQMGDDNWDPAPSVERTFDVAPAVLTIVGANLSRVYATTNPPLTGTLSGVKNGDPISATYSTIAVVNSPAGTYAITPALDDPAGRLGNYIIQITNGQLTVLRAPTLGTLTSSANPVLPGTPITFTHSVVIGAGSAAVLAGAVQWKVDGTNFGDLATLTDGVAVMTSSTLPAGLRNIVAEYSGDQNIAGVTNSLSPPQVINTPPVTAPDIIERSSTNGTKVAITALLANDQDADGNALDIIGVLASTNGATVMQTNGWIFYEAPANFTNTDSFTYTVQDIFGATALGEVTVIFLPDVLPTLNIRISDLGDGSYRIRIDGIPGRTYRIEYTDSWAPLLWEPLTSGPANQYGTFEYTDTPPQGTQARYYRSVSP